MHNDIQIVNFVKDTKLVHLGPQLDNLVSNSQILKLNK